MAEHQFRDRASLWTTTRGELQPIICFSWFCRLLPLNKSVGSLLRFNLVSCWDHSDALTTWNEIFANELVEELRMRGLDLPLLIRFPNILQHRIQLINECFQQAIEEYGYEGRYRGVFPIKVNQQRHLVEEIVSAGRPWRYL